MKFLVINNKIINAFEIFLISSLLTVEKLVRTSILHQSCQENNKITIIDIIEIYTYL